MSKTKIVYISGKMSGMPEWNFPAFMAADARLREAGYYTVNPAELNPHDTPWVDCLRKDLRYLTDVDGIAMIPGWENSRGARLELAVAIGLGLFVIDAITLNPLDITCEFRFDPRGKTV
jgi:hypothetical protein